MRSIPKFFFPLAGLIVIGTALLQWQRTVAAQLRDKIATRRYEADEWMRLNTEHQRLVSSQVTSDELKKLTADRHAVSALLGEIETMKRRANSPARSSMPSPVAKPAQLAMARGSVPASLWKNSGQETPGAAFETLLWASAGGDIDSLARVLDLDSVVRTEAIAILDKLPPAMRQEIATPERLVALLTAKDAPLGNAEILSAYEEPSANQVPHDLPKVGPSTTSKLNARVVDTEGNAKELLLTMRADKGVWRLVVPDTAMKKYVALLQSPADSAGSTGNTPR